MALKLWKKNLLKFKKNWNKNFSLDLYGEFPDPDPDLDPYEVFLDSGSGFGRIRIIIHTDPHHCQNDDKSSENVRQIRLKNEAQNKIKFLKTLYYHKIGYIYKKFKLSIFLKTRHDFTIINNSVSTVLGWTEGELYEKTDGAISP